MLTRGRVERSPCEAQPRVCGVDRNRERSGDLGNRDIVQRVEDQDRSLLLGHRGEAPNREALLLLSLDDILWQRACILDLGVIVEWLRSSSIRTTAKIPCDAVSEPEEPRPERTGFIVEMKLLVDVDEHLVGCVVEIGFAYGEAPQGPNHVGQFGSIKGVEIERHRKERFS